MNLIIIKIKKLRAKNDFIQSVLAKKGDLRKALLFS